MRRRALSQSAILLVLSLITASRGSAQLLDNLLPSVTVTPVISGSQLSAQVAIAGLSIDLSIAFEQVVGLSPGALSITASVVNPLDPRILGRFPSSVVSIPVALPVVLKITPTAGSGLAFSGVYSIALHTTALTLGVNSPLRLYRAPDGGAFQDMTGFLSAGSVRAGGTGPGFSEFLIVADLRPLDGVISSKLARLQSDLSANQSSIDPAVYADLLARLASLANLVATGAVASAIDAASDFSNAVKARSGNGIPDVWHANSSLVNVAGILRSDADTLRFSLVVKSNL